MTMKIEEAVLYSNGRCEGIGSDKCGYIIHQPPRHNYTTIHREDGEVIRMQVEFATSKYRPYLEDLSRWQCLFNPTTCCIRSPFHGRYEEEEEVVYYKSTKNLTSVRWMADVGGVEDVILSTLTGDVIVKGKIDHEMEAVLILYKYASYLRYAIHWPTPSTTTTSTQTRRVSDSGVWYEYRMIRREGFIIDVPEDLRTAFGQAFIKALKKAKLPYWVRDALPEWMKEGLLQDGSTPPSSCRLPTVSTKYDHHHYDNNNDDIVVAIDNRNPVVELPTITPSEEGGRGGGMISMVFYQDATICFNHSSSSSGRGGGGGGVGCLIAHNEGNFHLLLLQPRDHHHDDDDHLDKTKNLFWLYAHTSSHTATQIWSSSCLPTSSLYTRPVALVRIALRYIHRNSRVLLPIPQPSPSNEDHTLLRLLHQHTWPNVGCFFCYQMQQSNTIPMQGGSCSYYSHRQPRRLYRCLFTDRSRITFLSSDKGGRGIDEATGLFKYMSIHGEEREMSWSGCRKQASNTVSQYVDAALAFVRWVIIQEDGGKKEEIDDRSVTEIIEDIIQRGRDMRMIHKLGGSCNTRESAAIPSLDASATIAALHATRAFLNCNFQAHSY